MQKELRNHIFREHGVPDEIIEYVESIGDLAGLIGAKFSITINHCHPRYRVMFIRPPDKQGAIMPQSITPCSCNSALMKELQYVEEKLYEYGDLITNPYT